MGYKRLQIYYSVQKDDWSSVISLTARFGKTYFITISEEVSLWHSSPKEIAQFKKLLWNALISAIQRRVKYPGPTRPESERKALRFLSNILLPI